ncbi:unnamed protein product [Dicrocoelium dendriticum]|nr:unnamed protein product [Dicrocoelium dendriticum]
MKTLIHKVLKYPCLDGALVACTFYGNRSWILQMSENSCLYSISVAAETLLSEPFIALVNSRLDDDRLFIRAHFLSAVYCVALSGNGRLHIFNLAAVVCVGVVTHFPFIKDFVLISSDNTTYDQAYPGLPKTTLAILRDPSQSDRSLGDLESNNALIEIVQFPTYDVLHTLCVDKTCWLLPGTDLISSGEKDAKRVLFAELTRSASGVDILSIKSVQSITPTERILKLVEEKQFDEAKKLLRNFHLDSSVYQSVILAELRHHMECLGRSPECPDSDGRHLSIEDGNQLIGCLREIDRVQLDDVLLAKLISLDMPCSDLQQNLLLLLKEKLLTATEDQMSIKRELVAQVFHRLRRIKTFLILHGSSRFEPEIWKQFVYADVYILFVRLLADANRPAGYDLSKAFLFWELHKDELTSMLNHENLERLLDFFSRRPLTYPNDASLRDAETHSDLVAVETAVQRWIRGELLPAMVRRCPESLTALAQFIVNRVRQLESHHIGTASNTAQATALVHETCPFVWPSAALTWIEDLLAATYCPQDQQFLCETAGDTVCRYLSGLASLDPEIDPFFSLRRLREQLLIIENLSTTYKLRLTLDRCDGETEESIAYRILDISFTAGTATSLRPDPITQRYLTDHSIDDETFYIGYSIVAIDNIKKLIHSPFPNVSLMKEQCQPSSNDDLHSLLQKVCIVASWLPHGLGSWRVVTGLAAVLPLPWPQNVVNLVETEIDHFSVSGSQEREITNFTRLRRLLNLSKVYHILQRYELEHLYLTEDDLADASELLKRAVYRIFLRSRDSPDKAFRPIDEVALNDARLLTQLLIDRPVWELYFTRLRVVLALEFALSPTADDLFTSSSIERRLAYALAEFDEACYSFPGSSVRRLRLRKHLVAVAFQWIGVTSQLYPSASPEAQLLAELHVCLAHSIAPSSSSTVPPHQLLAARLRQWLTAHYSCVGNLIDAPSAKLYRCIHYSAGDAPLNERCRLSALLASSQLQDVDLACVTNFEIPASIKQLYRITLPELQPILREQVVEWTCFSLLIRRATDLSLACPLSAASVASVFTQLDYSLTLLGKLLKCLSKHSTHRHACYTPITRCASPMSGGLPDLFNTCNTCASLWNSPLAHTGAVLNLWCETLSFQLLKPTALEDILDWDSLHRWLCYCCSYFEQLVQLWHWTGGQSQLAGCSRISSQSTCTGGFQIGTPQFTAIHQIFLAFIGYFRSTASAISLTHLPPGSYRQSPLEKWMYGSLFRETAVVPSINEVVKCVRISLTWLSDVFSWLLNCHSSRSSVTPNDSTSTSLGTSSEISFQSQLTKGALELCNSWAWTFGLPITASLPLCFGFNRLVYGRPGQNLWTYGLSSDSFSDPSANVSVDITSNQWHEHCTRVVSSAFMNVLNPPAGGYLDQTFALCLSLATSVEEAIGTVRNIISSSRSSPKKMLALSAIVYAYLVASSNRNPSLLELSQTMARTWHWTTILRSFKVNMVQNEVPFEDILDRLCRMVPSIEHAAYHSPVAVLWSKKKSSPQPIPLPSLRLLWRFANDFRVVIEPYLVAHLKLLFSLPLAHPSPENTSIQQFWVIMRARPIFKYLLLQMTKGSLNTDLKTLLEDLIQSTSPYDHERLRFIFSMLSECSSSSVDQRCVQLLHLLGTYQGSPTTFPGGDENEPYFTDFPHTRDLTTLPIQRRLPYHQLFTDTLPTKVIRSEVRLHTLKFWLRVDKLMKWNSADDLRLLAARSLINRYEEAKLLPLTQRGVSSYRSPSATLGWDRCLPCLGATEGLFKSLRLLLSSVTSRMKVISFLTEINQRLVYGPHKLAVAEIARDLAQSWLLKADEELRLKFASQCDPSDSNIATPSDSEDGDSLQTADQLPASIKYWQDVFDKVDSRHKQLAIEACLHEHHLVHWDEVLQSTHEPTKLIVILLSKLASIASKESTFSQVNECKPVYGVGLRTRALRALPLLAKLASLDLRELGCRLVLDHLQLPSRLLSSIGGICIHANTTDASFAPDLTMTSFVGTSPEDITLNTTMLPSVGPSWSDSPSPAPKHYTPPTTEDFVLAEFLLRIPAVREELLPLLHSFVLTEDSSASYVHRWRAAQCVLRSQLGFVFWPRLSSAELHSTLVRLVLLATCCTVPAHQRLLLRLSRTVTSQLGHSFTCLCPESVTNCIEQLLNAEVDLHEARTLAGLLVMEFQVTDRSIITRWMKLLLLTLKERDTLCTVRLLQYLCSSSAPWDAFAWLWSGEITHQHIRDLIRYLIVSALNDGCSSAAPDIPFNRILFTLLSLPFHDPLFERVLVQVASQIITSSSCSSQRVILFVAALHLLVTNSTDPEVAQAIRKTFYQVFGPADEETWNVLLAKALSSSQLYLTVCTFKNVI